MPTNPNPLDSSPRRGFIMAAVSTRPNDSKTSRRALPVVSLGRFPTQISILCPFPSYGTPIYGGRAKQRQRTREMGLEAGQASVTHDRASRLHQAIILSSEQHATDRYCTTRRHPCHSFFIYCSKIVLLCPPQRRSRESRGEWIIWQTISSPVRYNYMCARFRTNFPHDE